MDGIGIAAVYGAVALGHLARAEGAVRVRDVAAACDLPAPYLSQVIRHLARAGLVHTHRGQGGGVTIAKEPADITLADVCHAIDDCSTGSGCLLGTPSCAHGAPCPVAHLCAQYRELVSKLLNATTIEAFMRPVPVAPPRANGNLSA